MASWLLDRLKRSLFKNGQGAGPQKEEVQEAEEEDGCWEVDLQEEEGVAERLRGKLCFDRAGGEEEGGEGQGEGLDSVFDFLAESMEEGLSSKDTSPLCVSGLGPSPSTPTMQRQADSLSFEVTDASIVQEATSKYVLYTLHVILSSGSDKTPAIITRRYSDFQRLHAMLCRNHRDQMERVCFPRKKLRRNFTAETIAKRSRAFEQYLSHLCSLGSLQGALCLRHFFYLKDLQTAQMLIRVAHYQEALGPLLNAKRLQHKLSLVSNHDNQAQAPPPASSHWFFTLVGLSCCFQEVDQLEEARDHCDHALHVLTLPRPSETKSSTEGEPLPLEDTPLPHSESQAHLLKPHPLLLPLLQVVVRLSWQTGKDKRQWEKLLQQMEEQRVGLDNQPTIKEFLVKHNLQEEG